LFKGISSPGQANNQTLNREKYKRPREHFSLNRLKQLNPTTDIASNQSAVSQAPTETTKHQ
jgi:hypothetical protein